MTTPARTTQLPARVRRGYGLGSMATGSFGTVPGLLLLPYLTDRLGVAAGLAGLIVFLPKAWDVILNPVSGRISDRSTHPNGRRRPFLVRAGIALASAFALLFAGPTAPTGLAAAWVIVAFLACATAYSFFQVPYSAMPAELTDSYDERTRMMTWRVIVLAVAILVSGGVSPAIRDALGPEWGYRAVGVFVGLLLLAGALGASWATKGAPMSHAEEAGVSAREQLRIVATDRNFRMLLLAFVTQALATGGMLAGVDYLAKHVLGQASASTILFVCYVAPALVVTPIWERVGRRSGKRAGFTVSTGLFVVGALATYLLRHQSLAVVALAVALVGVGYAGTQMFPMAMVPDVAAADAERSGQNRIGVFTGVWTAGETLGLALGPALYAGVLALGGYVSSTAGDVAQTDSAKEAIALGFGVVPAALMLVSLLFIRAYRADPRA